jgi:peptidoglycan-N-acetylglucosamine deacetylase
MAPVSAKPPATLSLDLDNLWSYLRAHGDDRWREYPSYLDCAVPRLLRLLDTLALRITIFVVGRDIELPRHGEIFAPISNAGHELANHSYEHTLDFHRAAPRAVIDEIVRTESAIEAIGGRRPVGFRGPSFRLSKTILETLALRGYRYDASTFPTFAGPLARAYHLTTSRLDRAGKARARDLFGSMRDGLRPLRPYRWQIAGTNIIELPVTTFPLIRTPIHLTYINFIADYSPLLARAYITSALRCYRASRIAPSLLLHAADFIGADDRGCPRFLPGMKRNSDEKIALVRCVLEGLRANFDIMTMARYVETIDDSDLAASRLPDGA